jgi:hypothetical protein
MHGKDHAEMSYRLLSNEQNMEKDKRRILVQSSSVDGPKWKLDRNVL